MQQKENYFYVSIISIKKALFKFKVYLISLIYTIHKYK